MKHALRNRTIRLRAAEDGTPGLLTGVATVFDTPYRIAPRRTETVTRETFETSLRNTPVIPIFWGHGWAKGTNETPIGVARLRNDEGGVTIQSAQLNMENDKAKDIWFAMTADESGEAALREWSLGFLASQVRQREVAGTPDDLIERGDIIEVSVVLRGAAPTFMGADGSAYAMREGDYLALREAEIDAGTVYTADSPAASGADAGVTNEAPAASGAETETGTSEVIVEETSEPSEVELRQLQLLQSPGFRAAVRAQITDTA